MPATEKNQQTRKVRDRANNENLVPRTRIAAAREDLKNSHFSDRAIRTAKRVAKLFITNEDVGPDVRKKAQSLLEFVYSKRDEEQDDEVVEVLSGVYDPPPRGAKRPDAAESQPEDHSCGITTFDQAVPFVEGLATFNFSDPRGLEGIRGEPWKNYHAVLLESIGERVAAHDLYADIDARIGEDHLTRKAARPEQLKSAIVKFVDRHRVPSKRGFQFRIVDWRILPISPVARLAVNTPVAPTSVIEQKTTAAIPERKDATVPQIEMRCSICQASSEAFPAPPHDCQLFMAPTTVGLRRFA